MRGGGVGRRAARRVGRRGWPRRTAAALLAPGLLAGLVAGLAGGLAAQARPAAADGAPAARAAAPARMRAASNLSSARRGVEAPAAGSGHPAALAAAQGATLARVWTLAAALRRALGQSQQLKAAGAEARAAKAGIASARSGLWPRLSVGEGVTRGDDPVYVFGALLRQHAFGAANFNLPSLNRPGALTDWQSSAQANVSLWDGGKTRAAIRGAKAGYRAAGAARRQTREQVLAATVAAYYGLREAEANWRTARRAVRAAEQSQQDAQARYRAGMAVEADELSADVYANRARQARAEAAGALAMARARLNQRLGRPLAAPLALAAASASNGTAPLPATLAAWQVAARRLRPDLARARAQTAAARAKEGEARAAWWPQASAFASVERDQSGFTGAGGSDWMAGVQVRWSVFGGGARRAAQAQARAGTAAAQAQASSLSRAAAVEVQAAWYRWQTARRLRALSRENARRAAAALAMLRRRYRAGLTTLRTVLDAETDWTRARAEEAQAEYGWQMSRAEALASLGELNYAHAAALAVRAAGGGMAAGGAADDPATSGPAAWTVER